MLLKDWLLMPTESFVRSSIVNGKSEKLECDFTTENEGTDGLLFRLSYVMALLGLQLVLSPFIVRSRRNYREGLLFASGSVSCLFVWIGWTVAYGLFKDAYHREISVVCGLVATPTILLLVVFVPKVRLFACYTTCFLWL